MGGCAVLSLHRGAHHSTCRPGLYTRHAATRCKTQSCQRAFGTLSWSRSATPKTSHGVPQALLPPRIWPNSGRRRSETAGRPRHIWSTSPEIDRYRAKSFVPNFDRHPSKPPARPACQPVTARTHCAARLPQAAHRPPTMRHQPHANRCTTAIASLRCHAEHTHRESMGGASACPPPLGSAAGNPMRNVTTGGRLRPALRHRLIARERAPPSAVHRKARYGATPSPGPPTFPV